VHLSPSLLGMSRVEMLEGVAEVPRDEWNALVGTESPFLEWDWLASLEEAGTVGNDTGWLPRPLVVREGARLLAAAPAYLKAHSEGEFVFDWGWADAAERAGIRYYPKLLVGVPFTPVTGARFLVAPGEDRTARVKQLGAALREICASNELSGVHVNFLTEKETEPLVEDGYLLRIGLQYHWSNAAFESFEDYLARFRSKRRNQIRREQRALQEQGVTVEALVGDAIPDALFPKMYRCYLSTIENHQYFGRRYLNPEFFELLRERFRKRLCFMIARRGDELVAGTLNVLKGDTLYGRYWGALQSLPYLHFNVCYYGAIRWCIEAGIARFEPGAGGNYKFLRGFDAQPTYSAHYLADARLADAVARFLESERSEAHDVIANLQERSALKPSPTAEPHP